MTQPTLEQQAMAILSDWVDSHTQRGRLHCKSKARALLKAYAERDEAECINCGSPEGSGECSFCKPEPPKESVAFAQGGVSMQWRFDKLQKQPPKAIEPLDPKDPVFDDNASRRMVYKINEIIARLGVTR